MDYSKFLSNPAQRRKPSCISELRKVIQSSNDELVWLASGMPNPRVFPFTGLKVTLEGEGGGEVTLSKEALVTGLQYGPSHGYPPLVKHLKGMVERHHAPPLGADTDVVVTVGNQDGVCKALETLLDPGDYIVLSNPCYSDVLCMLSPLAPQILGVEEDEEGIRVDLLEEELEKAVKSGTGTPKAIYLVPYSSNPSGKNISERRRRDIYSIARKYDLIIIEDDPYYFLSFIQESFQSFLSMDVDGRVLRFDSFSKIISAGLRVGYVSGPPPLLRALTLQLQSSCICPPMLSQVLIHELLTSWGDEGFDKHVSDALQFYRSQRDAMIEAVQTHLTGLCEWTVPQAGIFIWLKAVDVADTYPMLMERGATNNIILVPGREFVPTTSHHQQQQPSQYMRAAYSCATPAQMMKGMENLAKLIREEIKLASKTK